MNSTSTSGRIALLVAMVCALAALVGVTQAGALTQPTRSEADEALLHRSEALNEKYGLGSQATVPQGRTEAAARASKLRSEALNERYGLGAQATVSQGMTEAAARASRLRSVALNEKYGLGAQGEVAAASLPTSSTRGFAWGAFGIGAATMIALALLAGGIFVGGRLLAVRRGLAPRYRTT